MCIRDRNENIQDEPRKSEQIVRDLDMCGAWCLLKWRNKEKRWLCTRRKNKKRRGWRRMRRVEEVKEEEEEVKKEKNKRGGGR